MPTVIDSFVVELGLDSRKFTEGERDALSSLKKTGDSAVKMGNSIEASGKKISDVFSTIKGGAVGIIAALGGGEIAAFIDKVAHMDNATGRMAKTIGTSIGELSTWQGMVRQIGGDAQNATGALAGLQNAITNMLQGGGMMDPGAMFVLNQIGGVRGKTTDQIMRDLHNFYSQEIKAGRETPTSASVMLGRIPGMNKDMIDVILQTPEAFKKLEDSAKTSGLASKEAADRAADYVQKLNALALAWENLGRKVLPVLTWITNLLGKLLPTENEGLPPSMKMKPSSSSVPIKPGAGTASPETQKIVDALSGVSGVKQVTAMNDVYHQFLGGGHPAGRAVDLTVSDPRNATAVAASIRAKLAEMGINAKVINEYDPAQRSKNATGGHIHIGLNPTLSAIGPVGAPAAARQNISNRGGDVSTSTAYVDKVIVNTKATDAHGIARDITPAIQNYAKAMPANYGQV